MKYAALLALTLSAGCVDAKGSFDHFGDRIIDADTRSIDAPVVSSLPDITGEFFTVARPPFDEDRFFNFRSTYAFRAITDNTGEVDWSGQALDYTTFEPVGVPFTADNVQIGSDATASFPMTGMLDGRANSVSDSMIAVDAFIHATLVTPDFICGTLTGTAGGIVLEGTTFGAVRITGDTLPPPVHRCEDQP